MREGYICDHCRWEGPSDDLVREDLLDFEACPACWAAGFEAEPRERLGPVMEAVLRDDLLSKARPRTPKRLIFWTDEEAAIQEKVMRVRMLHESTPVHLETDIENARQRGFDFMRPEFRVRT